MPSKEEICVASSVSKVLVWSGSRSCDTQWLQCRLQWWSLISGQCTQCHSSGQHWSPLLPPIIISSHVTEHRLGGDDQELVSYDDALKIMTTTPQPQDQDHSVSEWPEPTKSYGISFCFQPTMLSIEALILSNIKMYLNSN